MELEQQIFGDDAQDDLPEEFKQMSADDIARRSRLLDNEIRVLKDESQRLQLDQQTMKEKVSLALAGTNQPIDCHQHGIDAWELCTALMKASMM